MLTVDAGRELCARTPDTLATMHTLAQAGDAAAADTRAFGTHVVATPFPTMQVIPAPFKSHWPAGAMPCALVWLTERGSGLQLQYHPEEWASLAGCGQGTDAASVTPRLSLRPAELVLQASWQPVAGTDRWVPRGADGLPMLAILTSYRLLLLDAGLRVLATAGDDEAQGSTHGAVQRVTSCVWLGATLVFTGSAGRVGAMCADGSVTWLCTLDASIEDPVVVRPAMWCQRVCVCVCVCVCVNAWCCPL